MIRHRSRWPLAVAGLLLVSACGSTVQTADGTPLGTIAAPGQATPGTSQAPGGGSSLNLLPAMPGSNATFTSGTAPAPGAGPTTGGSGGSGGSGAGSAVTSPISLGFLNTSVGNASDFGFDMGASMTGEELINGLVKGMNAEGGIAGRKIEAVISNTDTASTSWESDFAAACANFTEDHHVASVVGYDFVFLDSFETCLSKAGVSHLTTGYDPGDTEAFRKYPYLSAMFPSWDERVLLQVAAPFADGTITKDSKIGIIDDGCPQHLAAERRTMYPFIQQHGLNVVATVTADCPRGSGGNGDSLSQVQNAVLTFRSKGVDVAIMDGIPMYFFAQTADSQNYHPSYVLIGGAAALDSNPLPEAQMKNIHEYGFVPSMDVSPKRFPPLTAGQKRCVALMHKGGLTPSGYGDFHNGYNTCDGLFLLEAALKRTHGNSDPAAITVAITQLGTSYASAEMYDGASAFSSSDRTGAADYRPSRYDVSCKCFANSGPSRRLP